MKKFTSFEHCSLYVQDSSESAGGDLFQILEDCSRESYSGQV